MTLQEQIEQAEVRAAAALEAFNKAVTERDPNVKFYEDELVNATAALNLLKMRRPV
jgi:hypothetical protein